MQALTSSKLRLYLICAAGVMAMLMAAAASAATIFQENFAGGLGGFTASGSVTTGTYGARLRGGLSGGAMGVAGFVRIGRRSAGL